MLSPFRLLLSIHGYTAFQSKSLPRLGLSEKLLICVHRISLRAALLHVLANFIVVGQKVDETLPKNAINKFQVNLAFYWFSLTYSEYYNATSCFVALTMHHLFHYTKTVPIKWHRPHHTFSCWDPTDPDPVLFQIQFQISIPDLLFQNGTMCHSGTVSQTNIRSIPVSNSRSTFRST